VIAPRWRVLRQLRNGRRVDVAHPLCPGTDGLTLHAPDAETALGNAKRLVNDTRGLFVIPESN
jgi:hypothetical protein